MGSTLSKADGCRSDGQRARWEPEEDLLLVVVVEGAFLFLLLALRGPRLAVLPLLMLALLFMAADFPSGSKCPLFSSSRR